MNRVKNGNEEKLSEEALAHTHKHGLVVYLREQGIGLVESQLIPQEDFNDLDVDQFSIIKVLLNRISETTKSQLQKEIEYEYYLEKDLGKKIEYRIFEEAFLKLVNKYFTDLGLGFKQRRYESRAVGLWLYEYCSRVKIETGRVCTVSEASKAYEKYFNVSKRTEHTVYLRKLRDAEECIEKMNIFKTKEKPKLKKIKKPKKTKKFNIDKKDSGKNENKISENWTVFLGFWLWQYIIRNEEYKKDYAEFSKEMKDSKAEVEYKQEQYMKNMMEDVAAELGPEEFEKVYNCENPPIVIEFPFQDLAESLPKGFKRAFNKFYNK